MMAAQNTTPVALLPQVRSFQTSPATRDIDSAAKFIGAGAATVGVAGSGELDAKEIRRKKCSSYADYLTLLHFIHRSETIEKSYHCKLETILHLGLTNEHLIAQT
jgi:hypothetical protein